MQGPNQTLAARNNIRSPAQGKLQKQMEGPSQTLTPNNINKKLAQGKLQRIN